MDPRFDGTFPLVELPPETQSVTDPTEAETAGLPDTVIGGMAVAAAIHGGGVRVADLVERIGRPGPEHLDYASLVKAMISDDVMDAVRDPQRAQLVIYALLLDQDRQARERQLRYLQEQDAGMASLREAELLRAIAESLDCPAPPFLPGQRISAD
jgi:hypothetical protein